MATVAVSTIFWHRILASESKENASLMELRIRMALEIKAFAQRLRKSRILLIRCLGKLAGFAYRVYSLNFLSIDIPVDTKLGQGVRIYHGFGLVISSRAVIGDNVVLRHNTTIGTLRSSGMAPTLESGVDVGAGAIILGPVTIGRDAKIGAGAIVRESIEPGKVVK